MPESPLVIINVNIMSNAQNPQTEKLTHAITVRVTEDDYVRHSRLSATGKSTAKSAYIRGIRTQYHMESLDPDNPPPLDFNNEA